MMPEYDVLWNGSRRHPAGAYLTIETEAAYAARQRPYRTLREIPMAERHLIIAVAEECGIEVVVEHRHVSPLTVKALLEYGAVDPA